MSMHMENIRVIGLKSIKPSNTKVLDSEFQTVVSLWIIRVSYSFLESSQSQHKVWFPELFWGVRDATKGRCYKLLVLMNRIFQLFQNAGIEKLKSAKWSGEVRKQPEESCWLFWSSRCCTLWQLLNRKTQQKTSKCFLQSQNPSNFCQSKRFWSHWQNVQQRVPEQSTKTLLTSSALLRFSRLHSAEFSFWNSSILKKLKYSVHEY